MSSSPSSRIPLDPWPIAEFPVRGGSGMKRPSDDPPAAGALDKPPLLGTGPDTDGASPGEPLGEGNPGPAGSGAAAPGLLAPGSCGGTTTIALDVGSDGGAAVGWLTVAIAVAVAVKLTAVAVGLGATDVGLATPGVEVGSGVLVGTAGVLVGATGVFVGVEVFDGTGVFVGAGVFVGELVDVWLPDTDSVPGMLPTEVI